MPRDIETDQEIDLTPKRTTFTGNVHRDIAGQGRIPC